MIANDLAGEERPARRELRDRWQGLYDFRLILHYYAGDFGRAAFLRTMTFPSEPV